MTNYNKQIIFNGKTYSISQLVLDFVEKNTEYKLYFGYENVPNFPTLEAINEAKSKMVLKFRMIDWNNPDLIEIVSSKSESNYLINITSNCYIHAPSKNKLIEFLNYVEECYSEDDILISYIIGMKNNLYLYYQDYEYLYESTLS